MSQLEDQMAKVLGNPQIMEQIMSMAQAMGGSSPAPAPAEAPPALSPEVLNQLSGLMSRSRTDPQQQALLEALSPYISPRRFQKLEKAMQAARLAKTAGAFLGSGGLSLLTGR